jgi:hypothetical protein
VQLPGAMQYRRPSPTSQVPRSSEASARRSRACAHNREIHTRFPKFLNGHFNCFSSAQVRRSGARRAPAAQEASGPTRRDQVSGQGAARRDDVVQRPRDALLRNVRVEHFLRWPQAVAHDAEHQRGVQRGVARHGPDGDRQPCTCVSTWAICQWKITRLTSIAGFLTNSTES